MAQTENPHRRSLYNKLNGEKYYTGSFDDFNADMDDEETRGLLYGYLREDGKIKSNLTPEKFDSLMLGLEPEAPAPGPNPIKSLVQKGVEKVKGLFTDDDEPQSDKVVNKERMTPISEMPKRQPAPQPQQTQAQSQPTQTQAPPTQAQEQPTQQEPLIFPLEERDWRPVWQRVYESEVDKNIAKDWMKATKAKEDYDYTNGRMFGDLDKINEAEAEAELARVYRGERYDKDNFENLWRRNIEPIFNAEKKSANEEVEKATKGNYEGVNTPAQALTSYIYGEIQRGKYADPQKVIDNTATRAMESPAFSDYVFARMGIDPNEKPNGSMQSAPMSAEEKDLFQRLIQKESEEVSKKIQDKLYDTYKGEEAPKNVLEYLAGNTAHNFLMGAITDAVIRRASGSSGLREQLRQKAYQEYGKESGWTTRMVGGALPFAADLVTGGFTLPNLAGKGVLKGGMKLAVRDIEKETIKRAVASGMSKAAAKEAAAGMASRYIATQAPMLDLALRASAGAANFATFETQGEAVQQFGADKFKPFELLKSAAHGAVLGSVLSGMGGAIQKGTMFSNRATKIGADVAGLGAEIGIFALSDGIRRAIDEGVGIQDIDWAEAIGESAGMVAGMKIAGGALSPGTLSERYRKSVDYDLKFDKHNLEELQAAGYDLGSIFKIPNDLSKITVIKETGDRAKKASGDETIDIGAFEDVMKNPDISSETKRKIYYLATGKVATTEPSFKAEMRVNEDGTAEVETFNAQGNRIGIKDYKNAEEAQAAYDSAIAEARMNNINGLTTMAEILHLKDELDGRAIAKTREETGVDVEEALLKPREQRSAEEENALDVYLNNLMEAFEDRFGPQPWATSNRQIEGAVPPEEPFGPTAPDEPVVPEGGAPITPEGGAPITPEEVQSPFDRGRHLPPEQRYSAGKELRQAEADLLAIPNGVVYKNALDLLNDDAEAEAYINGVAPEQHDILRRYYDAVRVLDGSAFEALNKADGEVEAYQNEQAQFAVLNPETGEMTITTAMLDNDKPVYVVSDNGRTAIAYIDGERQQIDSNRLSNQVTTPLSQMVDEYSAQVRGQVMEDQRWSENHHPRTEQLAEGLIIMREGLPYRVMAVTPQGEVQVTQVKYDKGGDIVPANGNMETWTNDEALALQDQYYDELDARNNGEAVVEEGAPAEEPVAPETPAEGPVAPETPVEEPAEERTWLQPGDEEKYAEVKPWLDEHPDATRAQIQREFRLGYNIAGRILDQWAADRENATGAPVEEPVAPETPVEEPAPAETPQTEIPRTKAGDIDSKKIQESGNSDLMAQAYLQEFMPQIANEIAQAHLSDAIKAQEKEKSLEAKYGSRQKAVDFWRDVVGKLNTNIAPEEPVEEAPVQQPENILEAGNAAKEKWDGAEKLDGNKASKTLPSGQKIKGHFVLVEEGAATPSHNPSTFGPSEGFPVTAQGQNANSRDYENDRNAQASVQQMGTSYDGRAIDDMPVVSAEGIVWSGNNRVMSGQLAAQNGTDGAYKDALIDNASMYGFSEEQVANMEHPRVYFVPDAGQGLDYTPQTFNLFNAPQQKEETSVGKGVKMGKVLDDRTFNLLSQEVARFGNLANVFKSPNASNEIVKILQNADEIVEVNQQTLPRYIGTDGMLTEDGQNLVNSALVGYMFRNNPEALSYLESLPKSAIRQMADAMPELVANAKMGEYSLGAELAEAVKALHQQQQSGQSLDDFMKQYDLFADGGTLYGETTRGLVEAMSGRGDGLKALMEKYNTRAEDASTGQMGMFGNDTRESILRDVLGLPAAGEQTGGIQFYDAEAELKSNDNTDILSAAENIVKKEEEGISQGFGSAGTSLNQVPSGMRKVDWKSGTTNVDIGGGRFDTATEFLKEQGVENLVFDPFNRDAKHNEVVANRVREEKADTATCHNVLNVIDTEASRANVILQAAKAIKPDGTAYFTVYEGDKSGVGKQTKSDSWQNNRKTKDYVGEIEKYFDDVKVKNGVIIAKSPKPTDEQSVWDFDGNYDGNGIMFAVSPTEDMEYMEAVKAGDMETAQRMVVEAAKKAMPDTQFVDENGEPMLMSHHTDAEGFYVFDKGKIGTGQGQAFLGAGFNFSRGRGDSTYGSRNISAYLNAKTPLRSDRNTLSKSDIRSIIEELNAKYPEDKIEVNWGSMRDAVNALYEYGGDLDTYATLCMTYSGNSTDVMDVFAKRGFDSTIEYDNDGKIMDGVVFNPNQIKSADPVTYDDNGNVISLSERFNEDNEDIRFFIEQPASVFVSNAKKAVDGIKQDKATPEQWLAMITKNGGLKAGEDKWLGLSDWLKSQDKKTLTKQDVLDYIRENQIEVQDVEYADLGEIPSKKELEESPKFKELEQEFNTFAEQAPTEEEAEEEYYAFVDEMKHKYGGDWIDDMDKEDEARWDKVNSNSAAYEAHEKDGIDGKWDIAYYQLANKYGKIILSAFDYENGRLEVRDDRADRDEANQFLYGAKRANPTRTSYTTKGLDNKREIALVVPTIESWNESDQVHFGDAGDGRAVAWIRFGETTTNANSGTAATSIADELESKYGTRYYAKQNQMTDEEVAKYHFANYLERGENADVDFIKGSIKSDVGDERAQKIIPIFEQMIADNAGGDRVLVIDEIQSKRHQEGREHGYKVSEEKAVAEMNDFLDRMRNKYHYKPNEPFIDYFNDEEMAELDRLNAQQNDASFNTSAIPDAPFEKNWHELAMKRMLRYAAENGYDKVAWTKGAQQAERYRLGGKVKFIESIKDPYSDRSVYIRMMNNNQIELEVDDNGKVTYTSEERIIPAGSQLTDIIGKGLADKIMASEEPRLKIEGEDLDIGGEGMKGFYDKMLPSFMNKYGKKWGVKVEDITLPNVEESGRTMHSIDVTPEMKQSVMDEGQVMFSVVEPIADFDKSKLNATDDMEYAKALVEMENTRMAKEVIAPLVESIGKEYKGMSNVVISTGNDFLKKFMDEQPITNTEKSQLQTIIDGRIKPLLGYVGSVDKIIIFDMERAKSEIKPYLCHETAHRGVKQEYLKGYVSEWYNLLRGEDPRLFQGVWNFYSKRVTRNPEYLKEECVVHYLQNLITERGIDGAKDRLKEIAKEKGGNADSLVKLLDFIKYGQEGRRGPDSPDDGGTGGRGQRGSGLPSSTTTGGRNPIRGSTEQEKIGFSLKERNEENKRLAQGYKAGTISAKDLIKETLEKTLESNKDNLEKRIQGINALAKDVANIKRRVSALQRAYDKSTVEDLVKLADTYMKAGMFDDPALSEVERLIGYINNAAGKEDITEQAKKVVDIMLDHQLKTYDHLFAKTLKLKGSRTNSSGIKVQGKLDAQGQQILGTLQSLLKLNDEQFNHKVGEIIDGMASPDSHKASVASVDYQAVVLARQFRNGVLRLESEEEALKMDLKNAEEEWKETRKGLSGKDLTNAQKARREYIEETKDAIREIKATCVDQYRQVLSGIAGELADSAERAKAFREEEQRRVDDILHRANSDMQGISASASRQKGLTKFLTNNVLFNTFAAPLPTFEKMMQFFGRAQLRGEGYLFDYFVRPRLFIDDRIFKNRRADFDAMCAKMTELTGNTVKLEDWPDIYDWEGAFKPIKVSWNDGNGMEGHTLTQGQALYIYAANRQTDGRMKLRAMGITEEEVNRVIGEIAPGFLSFADWIIEDFLPKMRERMNAVHEKLFGAPMEYVENYFPLVINKNAIPQEVNLEELTYDERFLSTITGSIKARTRNNYALDIENADFFGVIAEHVRDVETWIESAQWTKDLNTLLSSTRFQNQVKNTASRYGSGDTAWKNFTDVCAIAGGFYIPKTSRASSAYLNISKGVIMSDVAGRLWTALKQLLSSSVYLTTTNPMYLAKSLLTPAASWNWAVRNMPGFQERFFGRAIGNPLLEESDLDWMFMRSRNIKAAGRLGMTPNAFVDALTVSIGAKAAYDTSYSALKSMGFPSDFCRERALSEAALLPNRTQQSSVGQFLAPVQRDRDLFGVGVTTFGNASFGYGREAFEAVAKLTHLIGSPQEFKSRSERTVKKLMREGLSEEQAKKAVSHAWLRILLRNILLAANFGFFSVYTWKLGSGALVSLAFGGGKRETKKQEKKARKSAELGPIEGLAGGRQVSDFINGFFFNDEKWRDPKLYEDFLGDELSSIKRKLTSGRYVEAAYDQANLLARMVFGINPKVVVDAVTAATDYFGDNEKGVHEFLLFAGRVMNAPKSEMERIYLIQMGLNKTDANGNIDWENIDWDDVVSRYAHYRRITDAGYLNNQYEDDEAKAIEEKNAKNFRKKLKEIEKEWAKDAEEAAKKDPDNAYWGDDNSAESDSAYW